MKRERYMKEMSYTDPYLIHTELIAVIETLDIITENLSTDLMSIKDFTKSQKVADLLIGDIEKHYMPVLMMLQRNLTNLADEVLALEERNATQHDE